MDIISELKKMPNCGYTYCSCPGKGLSHTVVILGRSSCPIVEEEHVAQIISSIIGRMETIYQKMPLSIDDKKKLAKLMDEMLITCEPKSKKIRTPKQQEELITTLADAQVNEIMELLLMYKDCYSFYLDYCQKR